MRSGSTRLSQERVGPARGRRSWALRATAFACLLLAVGGVWAAGPKGTPDRPELYYWYLNTSGPGPDVGDIDPMVREIADAFGRGDYYTVRSLAQALLDSAGGEEAATESSPRENTGLRVLALAYLVESHLAEGDFESARDAAARFASLAPGTCGQTIKRVNTREADYEASVSRLQYIVDTTDEPAQEAKAKLGMARTHRRVGRAEVARRAYQEIVQRWPEDAVAGQALSEAIGLHLHAGQFDEARAAAFAAIEEHPDSQPVVRAAVNAIAQSYLATGDAEAALRDLRRVGQETPNVILREEVAAAIAGPCCGYLRYAASSRKPEPGRVIDHIAWSYAQLSEGPLRARAGLYLARHALWNGPMDAAFRYAGTILACSDVGTDTVREAWDVLLQCCERGSVTPQMQAWIAVACERVGCGEWPAPAPASTREWRQVGAAVEELISTEISASPWGPLAAARCYLRGRMPEKAATCLALTVQRWPDRQEACVAAVELAPLLVHVGRAEEAAHLCRGLLSRELPPGLAAEARRELARALLFTGREDEALGQYYQIIADAPSSPEGAQAVRVLAELMTDWLGADPAAEVLQQISDGWPATPVGAMAQYELAELATAAGLTASEAYRYLAVIEQYPDSEAGAMAAASVRNRAPEVVADIKYLHSWGKHEEVVLHLARLAPYLDSLDEPTLSRTVDTLLSSARHSGGLAEQAKEATRALLQSSRCQGDPAKMALLYRAHGELADQTGDTRTALWSWQCLVDEYPTSGPAARTAVVLGERYLAARQPEQAVRAYRLAAAAVGHLSAEERARAKLGLAYALESLDRTDEAIFEHRAVMALAPGSAAAIEAAEALVRLGAASPEEDRW